MKTSNHLCKRTAIAVMLLTMTASMIGFTALSSVSQNSRFVYSTAAEESYAGRYTVNMQLMQFHSTDLSMGNEAMLPTAEIIVKADKTASLEISLKSLTYLNRDGYLGWLKKVTRVISENRFQYPIEIETIDAAVIEEYENVYDDFNKSGSAYLDEEVAGKWYAKKISIPLDITVDEVTGALNGEDDILVQVYVPVMESIQEGGGTKFATIDLDWDSLTKISDDTGTPAVSVTTHSTEESATTVTTTETTALPKETVSELDKDDLADGKYELYAEMIKTDRESYSMSNNGINHTVQLEVVNGEYYLTVQFKGLAIYNQFGYLMNLSYYNKGYDYNEYGAPQGSITPAEVISTYDIIDQYNDAQHLYPQLLKFPLVDKASGEYVPLQVFVPIMEAIAEGTGTQSVLMRLDWSTLKKIDDGDSFELEEPDEQSPEFNFTDAATGVTIHADKGVLAAGTEGKVTAVTEGSEYTAAKSLISDVSSQFKMYDIALTGEDGAAAKPNGKLQISIPIPSDYQNPAVYRIENNKKTLIGGTAINGMYTFSAKETGTYVIVNKNSTKTNISASGSPKTGDAGIGSAAISLMAAAVGMIWCRKRREK